MGSSQVGASPGGAAPVRASSVAVVPMVRSTTHPIVVAWTSNVNRTTPKVISWVVLAKPGPEAIEMCADAPEGDVYCAGDVTA